VATVTRILFHHTRDVPVNLTLRLGRFDHNGRARWIWQLLVYRTRWRWWAPLEIQVFHA